MLNAIYYRFRSALNNLDSTIRQFVYIHSHSSASCRNHKKRQARRRKKRKRPPTIRIKSKRTSLSNYIFFGSCNFPQKKLHARNNINYLINESPAAVIPNIIKYPPIKIMEIVTNAHTIIFAVVTAAPCFLLFIVTLPFKI